MLSIYCLINDINVCKNYLPNDINVCINAQSKVNKTKVNNIPPIPPEEVTDEKFLKFCKWVNENAPRVARMKEPFTEHDFRKIREKYNSEFIQEILLDMHNWGDLKKRVSAKRTFDTFANKRNDAKK